MKQFFLAVLFVRLLGIGSPAEAAKYGVEISGSDLLELCENGGDDYSDGLCLGSVIGVFDISFDTRLCCLEKSTNKQIGMVIVKWMKTHPEELHFTAKWIVAKALFNVFPCRE
jgi:hypothetical protein|tara:strand:- start:248 stop:586 length:339 start_codon:yes stop_codon:yes gene_type:complete